MKKLLFGTMFLVMVFIVPIPTMAQVDIRINIPLPPPLLFPAPPEVIVIPGTYVYAIPDIDDEIFFWDGWWWRLWEGRWYRSRYYDRGWVYYRYIPYFYYDIDFAWRKYYRDRVWHGHRWEYQRIPYQHLQKNWRVWQNNRYWERERRWNVEKYQPPTPNQREEFRRQRRYEYSQRPEVRRHEQWKQQQQRQPQLQKPQRSQPPGKPEGGAGERQYRR